MYCPLCGQDAGDSKFCANCGNALPPPVQEQVPPVTPAQGQVPPPAYVYMPPLPPAAPIYQPEPIYQPQPLYAPAPVPVYAYGPAPAQKIPAYKRWWFWLLMTPVFLFALFIVIGIASAGGSKGGVSAKEDLRSYFTEYEECTAVQSEIGSRLQELDSMEPAEMMIALVEIQSDFEALVTKVEAITPKYQKLQDIHDFYLSTVKAMQAAYDELVNAAFQRDSEAVDTATEAVQEAVNNQLLVMVKLVAYAKAIGLEGFAGDAAGGGAKPV